MQGVTFYKYQGAGNDFLIADNRDGRIALSPGEISAMCDRRYGVGADGVMLLEPSDSASFMMRYYNSDGSGGMMCGNGGRCIAAFALDMGIVPGTMDVRSVSGEGVCRSGDGFEFEAADGIHKALVLDDDGRCKSVRLKMKDVAEIVRHEAVQGLDVPSDGYFLDTGTRHFVRFVKNVAEYDVVGEGRALRYADEFSPEGTNVNYVGQAEGHLAVRTYEKGVENETFACGTGIVASCVAAYTHGLHGGFQVEGNRVSCRVKALKDWLSVDFIPHGTGSGCLASDVWLTGPAVYVAGIHF